jgi:hypothetical protein
MPARATTLIAASVALLNILLAVLAYVFGALNGWNWLQLLDEGPGVILAISVSIVGAFVASRRPRNPIGWVYCAVGFWQALVSFTWEYALFALVTRPGSLPAGPEMAWLSTWTWMPGLGLLLTFALLLFPDGRLPSPRWRVVAWLSAFDLALAVPFAISLWPLRGVELLQSAEETTASSFLDLGLAAIFPLMLVCGLASVASLVVRFRRSHGVERQQLKWMTYAAAVTFVFLLFTQYVTLPLVLEAALIVLVVPSLAAALGVAILRYRLYDIDLIIRRTLVYSALTVALGLVYFGSVVLLQRVFAAFSTGQSAAAIVVSTLAIAALFAPLRGRLQDFIDRRFYRRKYDAARTLAEFAAAARDETDLDQLAGRLVEVVEGTMQPEHVSLWLAAVRAGGWPGREE